MSTTAMSAAVAALCDPMEMHNKFVSRECYIEARIAEDNEKNPSTSMWLNKIVDSEPFPQGEGYEMTKWIFRSSPAPQVETRDLFKPIMASTDGSGTNPLDPDYVAPHDACAWDCHTVTHGMDNKTWSLEQACLTTAWLCAMDIVFKWGFRQTLDAWGRNLARISRTIKAQWNRDKTVAHSQLVAAHPEFADDIAMISGVKGLLPSIPAGGVCKPLLGYLESMYDALCRQYLETAVGQSSGGAPVFAVCCGRELAYEFRRSDPQIRVDDRYSADANFYKEGFTRGEFQFHGFVFLIDVEAPRFIEDPDRAGYLKRVWPYESTETTIGERWDSFIGSAYDKAPYELLLFLPRGQFTNVTFSLGRNLGGGTSFGDQDFDGMVKWQQFAAPACEDENKLKGRWKMQWIRGTKPGDHEFGLGLVFARPDVTAKLRLLCSDEGICDPCTGSSLEIPADTSLTCATVDGEANQITLTGSNLFGSETDPTTGDTVFVTFDNGAVEPAEVIAITTMTGNTSSITVEFTHAVNCDYGGGVQSVSTVSNCIGVEAQEFGDSPNGSGKKALRVVLVNQAILPNTAVGATYTAQFADGTTGTATLLGDSVVEGETNYHLEFSSAFASGNSLNSITALGGIVCLTVS